MMREILFRGKCYDDGEWLFGSLLDDVIVEKGSIDVDESYIGITGNWSSVNPETVGQYTGLKDKNGKRIFEGDIVKDDSGIGVVSWIIEHCCFLVKAIENGCITGYHFLESDGTLKYTEVIGNIHDNPELLEVQG